MDQDLKRRREAVLQRHLDGESDKDVDAVLATMPSPRYELVTVDRVLEGRDEVGPFLQKMFDGLPEYRHHGDVFHHADDAVVVEVTTKFPDSTVKTVGIFTFDGDRLLAERVYVPPELLLPLIPD